MVRRGNFTVMPNGHCPYGNISKVNNNNFRRTVRQNSTKFAVIKFSPIKKIVAGTAQSILRLRCPRLLSFMPSPWPFTWLQNTLWIFVSIVHSKSLERICKKILVESPAASWYFNHDIRIYSAKIRDIAYRQRHSTHIINREIQEEVVIVFDRIDDVQCIPKERACCLSVIIQGDYQAEWIFSWLNSVDSWFLCAI